MPLSDSGTPRSLVLVATRLRLRRRGSVARQIERSAGRELALAALDRLGRIDALTLGAGNHLEWPSGTRGSISHDRAGLCVAAVTGGGCINMVGIDVEEIDRLKLVSMELFTNATERRWLRHLARSSGGDALSWKARIFTAKEATWKALADFQGDDRVAVTFNRSGSFLGFSRGRRLEGITVAVGGEIFALAVGEHRPAAEVWRQRVLAMLRQVDTFPSLAETSLSL